MREERILDYKLAKEFEIYKLLHKTSVVEAKLQCFYKDLVATGLKVANFKDKSPDDKAKEHLFELLNDKDKFNRTYNAIWEEVKWSLP